MSNETKWTPGPWLVTKSHDGIAIAMGSAIISPYEYTTGHLWKTDLYWGEEDDEDVANAHLIAAAPELYEILSMLVDNSEAVAFYPSAIEQSDWGSVDFEEWAQRARAVLAKARGES